MSKSLKLTTLPKSTLSKNISEEKFETFIRYDLDHEDFVQEVVLR